MTAVRVHAEVAHVRRLQHVRSGLPAECRGGVHRQRASAVAGLGLLQNGDDHCFIGRNASVTRARRSARPGHLTRREMAASGHHRAAHHRTVSAATTAAVTGTSSSSAEFTVGAPLPPATARRPGAAKGTTPTPNSTATCAAATGRISAAQPGGNRGRRWRRTPPTTRSAQSASTRAGACRHRPGPRRSPRPRPGLLPHGDDHQRGEPGDRQPPARQHHELRPRDRRPRRHVDLGRRGATGGVAAAKIAGSKSASGQGSGRSFRRAQAGRRLGRRFRPAQAGAAP